MWTNKVVQGNIVVCILHMLCSLPHRCLHWPWKFEWVLVVYACDTHEGKSALQSLVNGVICSKWLWKPGHMCTLRYCGKAAGDTHVHMHMLVMWYLERSVSIDIFWMSSPESVPECDHCLNVQVTASVCELKVHICICYKYYWHLVN